MDFFFFDESYCQLHRMLYASFQTERKWRDKVGNIFPGFLSLMKVIVNCIECLMLIFSDWKKMKR